MPNLFLDPTFGAERCGPCRGVEGGDGVKWGRKKRGRTVEDIRIIEVDMLTQSYITTVLGTSCTVLV